MPGSSDLTEMPNSQELLGAAVTPSCPGLHHGAPACAPMMEGFPSSPAPSLASLSKVTCLLPLGGGPPPSQQPVWDPAQAPPGLPACCHQGGPPPFPSPAVWRLAPALWKWLLGFASPQGIVSKGLSLASFSIPGTRILLQRVLHELPETHTLIQRLPSQRETLPLIKLPPS